MKKIFVILLSCIVLIGCKQNNDTVKIGALLSLTGDNATQGKLAMNGILVGVDKINQAGGINGKKIELIIQDTGTSAKGTINAFKQVVSMNDIEGMIVTGDTEFQAINSLAETAKIPIMATICTGMLNEGRSEWLFRYCYNEEQEDDCLMKFIKEDLNINTIALLYPNTLFGQDFRKYSKMYIDKNEIKIVAEVAYDFNSTNQRSDAVKVMNTKPEIVCARGFGSALDALLRHISELGYTGSVVGDLSITTPSTIQNTNGIMEGAYIVASDLDLASDNENVKSYFDDYYQKYKINPCFWDAIGYDSFLFLVSALQEKERTNEDIKKILYRIQPEGLLLGNNKFADGHNDVSFDMHIFRLEQGVLKKIK